MGRCCNEPHCIICTYFTRVQLSIFSQMLLSELCTPSIKFLSPVQPTSISNCLIFLLFTRFLSLRHVMSHTMVTVVVRFCHSYFVFLSITQHMTNNIIFSKYHQSDKDVQMNQLSAEIKTIPSTPLDRDCISHMLMYYLSPLCSLMF